ncbi:MAG: hypothetical protein WBA09_22405 [Candidatus Acidiferrum sp.]
MADANVLLTTFTVSGITVAAINWLKRSEYFPWITKEKTTLLRGMSIVVAAASGVGIQHVWNSADHSLIISGLTGANMVAFLWAIIKTFTMNETIFQATKPASNPAVVEAVAPASAVEQGIVPEKK